MKKNKFIEKKSEKKITILNIKLSEATLKDSIEFKNELDLLHEKGKNKIVINLSDCRFIDSSFLGAIVSNLEKYRNIGGNIKVVYSGYLVKTIFEANGINRAMETFENIDDAINSYSQNVSAA